MIVSFCGHGDIFYDDKIKIKLSYIIECLIKNGATEFLFGGYGNFDNLSALAVNEFKKIYPHISLTLVIPYINRNYDTSMYDTTVYPPIEKVPKKYAIIKRNEWMIDQCETLVCYVNRDYGGAYITYSHARKNKKMIINLANQKES